jgi:hypothetical protein
MLMRGGFVRGLARTLPGVAALVVVHVPSAHADEIVLGPSIDVGARIAPPGEEQPHDEEWNTRVAVVSGRDAAMVVWADEGVLRGATLAHDGSLVNAEVFSQEIDIGARRVFGGYGGGRYLFLAQWASTHVVLLDETGALLATSMHEEMAFPACLYPGIPVLADGHFFIPCRNFVLVVDPDTAEIVAVTGPSGAGSDQAMRAIDCSDGRCVVVGTEESAPHPSEVRAAAIDAAGTEETSVYLFFRDALHAPVAVAEAEGGRPRPVALLHRSVRRRERHAERAIRRAPLRRRLRAASPLSCFR